MKSMAVIGGALALALLPVLSLAGVREGVERGAQAASGVVSKTEGAVKRGVGRAANAMERSASVTGGAVQRSARRMGLPTGRPASAESRGEQPQAPTGRN